MHGSKIHLGSTNYLFFWLHSQCYTDVIILHWVIIKTFFHNIFHILLNFFPGKSQYTYIYAPTVTHYKWTAVLRNKYGHAIHQKAINYAK